MLKLKAILVCLLWALCYPFITIALAEAPPFYLAFGRSLLAGSSLLLLTAGGSEPMIPRDLPSIPEQDIDIAYWAFVIAKECDSTVDIDHYLHTLDTMAAKIRYMVGPRNGDMVRFVMTQMFQFEPGEWNGGQIFSYDLEDPLGEKPGARLLTTYLDIHKGNCVSMPTLFLALMERVDPTILFQWCRRAASPVLSLARSTRR